MILYTVSCTFTDPAVADAWLAWLRGGHVTEVCAAGALCARIVRVDGPGGAPIRYDIHYRFASRADFERYERDHAPRLRAEGLARFPLGLGLAYTRTVGEMVEAYAPAIADA